VKDRLAKLDALLHRLAGVIVALEEESGIEAEAPAAAAPPPAPKRTKTHEDAPAPAPAAAAAPAPKPVPKKPAKGGGDNVPADVLTWPEWKVDAYVEGRAAARGGQGEDLNPFPDKGNWKTLAKRDAWTRDHRDQAAA
jgi:hypothetical protein